MQTIEIREYSEKDIPAMCGIWNEVVEDGVAFPQEERLVQTEAESFFTGQTFCAVAEEVESENILGLHRSAACENCIEQAHEKGFRIFQFNAVVATNIHARRLYERLRRRNMNESGWGVLKQNYFLEYHQARSMSRLSVIM